MHTVAKLVFKRSCCNIARRAIVGTSCSTALGIFGNEAPVVRSESSSVGHVSTVYLNFQQTIILPLTDLSCMSNQYLVGQGYIPRAPHYESHLFFRFIGLFSRVILAWMNSLLDRFIILIRCTAARALGVASSAHKSAADRTKELDVMIALGTTVFLAPISLVQSPLF